MADSESSSSSQHSSPGNASSVASSPASSLSSHSSPLERSPKRRKKKCTVAQVIIQALVGPLVVLVCHEVALKHVLLFVLFCRPPGSDCN